MLHYIILHYTTIHYITLYYTTLHYTILHYITWHYSILTCGEFLWSPEDPISQIHFPHPHVGAPVIFSDLLSSLHILNIEWGAESNGKLPHLFIPGKTAALVHECAVEDLPRQNCSLGSAFGQNNDIYIIFINYIIM